MTFKELHPGMLGLSNSRLGGFLLIISVTQISGTIPRTRVAWLKNNEIFTQVFSAGTDTEHYAIEIL